MQTKTKGRAAEKQNAPKQDAQNHPTTDASPTQEKPSLGSIEWIHQNSAKLIELADAVDLSALEEPAKQSRAASAKETDADQLLMQLEDARRLYRTHRAYVTGEKPLTDLRRAHRAAKAAQAKAFDKHEAALKPVARLLYSIKTSIAIIDLHIDRFRDPCGLPSSQWRMHKAISEGKEPAKLIAVREKHRAAFMRIYESPNVFRYFLDRELQRLASEDKQRVEAKRAA